MIRAVPIAVLACLAFAALPVRAAAPTPTQLILREAVSPADLRARLAAYARIAEAGDRTGAGEAWSYSGWSHWRGTQPDSAILGWRRALELRGNYEDRFDLADALLSRQAPGDIDEAVGMLSQALPEVQAQAPQAASRFQALLAWGRLVAGELEESRRLFDGVESEISRDPLWRYRLARATLTGPDQAKAIILLRNLALASRGQDEEVMQLIEMASQRIGQRDALDRDLIDKREQRDIVEDRVVTRIEGRRVRLAANDGFPLGGVLMESKGSGRHRPAIVLVAPGDTLSDFDSLGVALRSGGLHTLLLAVRGTGMSVAPACPLPVAWRGREEFMLRRTALDVRDAVRAVKLAVRNTDTSGVVVVASRSMALAGALAAAQDRRVQALVLLSPDPDPVDRGALIAALAKRRIPVFIQQTMEDFPNFELLDLAFRATDQPVSRLSDGRSGGHGAVAFKQDRRVTPRFSQWLKESLAGPAKKAIPPAKPR